jgi:hypothetical protein
MKEVWKLVPGLGREIKASSLGRIIIADYKRRVSIPRLGRIRVGGTGKIYKRRIINLRLPPDYKKKTYTVARLVCIAFHGQPPFEGAKCLHIDEDGLNNRPENLKWGTQKENLNAPGFIADRRSRMSNKRDWAKHWKKQLSI